MYPSWAEAMDKLHNPSTSMTGWLRKQSSNPCQWSQRASKQNVMCASIKDKGSIPVVCNISGFKDESKAPTISVLWRKQRLKSVHWESHDKVLCEEALRSTKTPTTNLPHHSRVWSPLGSPSLSPFPLDFVPEASLNSVPATAAHMTEDQSWRKCCFKLKTTRGNCLCPEFHLSGDLQAACRHNSGLDESSQPWFNVSQHHRQARILIKDDHNSGQGGYILYLRIAAHTMHVIHTLNAVFFSVSHFISNFVHPA